MADITMCNGNYCELRENCFRYKAKASEYRQSYFCKLPNATSYDCEYFWEIKCKYCNQENGVHKLSCPTHKIQINL